MIKVLALVALVALTLGGPAVQATQAPHLTPNPHLFLSHAATWTPRAWVHTAKAIPTVHTADDCDTWSCPYTVEAVTYCIPEGTQMDTPSASLVCRCEAQGTDNCSFDLIIQ